MARPRPRVTPVSTIVRGEELLIDKIDGISKCEARFRFADVLT
jgi:hypothetical protein